jgi:hypothetical protein
MMTTRRELMAKRDEALRNGDTAAFQALTKQIAELPMPGVAPLTQKDIDRYNRKGAK